MSVAVKCHDYPGEVYSSSYTFIQVLNQATYDLPYSWNFCG